MFGDAPAPQSERTPFWPRSPYAAAKVYAYWMVRNDREGYGLFACNGIMFNHESPRRGETFVSRKITRAVAAILAGRQKKLFLGNLEALRDWGYAPEYVEAIVLATEAYDGAEPVNIGAGFDISIKDLTELIAKLCGFTGKIRWDTTKPNGQPRRCLDTSRALKLFGFRAKTDFREGLIRTIEWYRKRRGQL